MTNTERQVDRDASLKYLQEQYAPCLDGVFERNDAGADRSGNRDRRGRRRVSLILRGLLRDFRQAPPS